ncbi:MAG: hypothetical protein HY690_20655 [Chloroflexi bacterium]|nr:hypothetical protein [Chloroflexota bacterium]
MPWYAVRTQVRKEPQAAAALEQRGAEVYLPLLRKQKPRAERRDWEPLFPCYLFASLEIPSETWLAARSAPGVAYFLGWRGEPSPLVHDFVPALKTRVDQANGAQGMRHFQQGDRLLITRGPLQYLEAFFQHDLPARGRSRVLVRIFQQLTAVELPADYLEPVDRKRAMF